jgi:GT2 family glycosyltransferase
MPVIPINKPKIGVVIVNWNSYVLILEAIKTILEFNPLIDFDFIVVDNNSFNRDGLVELKSLKCNLQVIENSVNVGFGVANNQGFKNLNADSILVLNPDTVQIDDSVTRAFNYFMANPNFGLLGIKHIDGRTGGVQPSAFRNISPWFFVLDLVGLGFLNKKGELVDHTLEQDVDWITGSFMLVRKIVIDQTSGFDPGIFLNNEDVEWCHRIKALGWRIRYCPDFSFRHIGGGTRHFMSDSTYSFKMSRLLFIWKSGFPLAAIAYYLVTVWFLFCAIFRDVLYFIFGKSGLSNLKLKTKRFLNFLLLKPITAGIN